MFLQCACVSILRAEKENGYADVASILGVALAWERSADAPPPGLTKPGMGADGGRSPSVSLIWEYTPMPARSFPLERVPRKPAKRL